MNYDFALVTLKNAASASAGYMGMTVGQSVVTMNLTTAGYPVRPFPAKSSIKVCGEAVQQSTEIVTLLLRCGHLDWPSQATTFKDDDSKTVDLGRLLSRLRCFSRIIRVPSFAI